MTSLSLDVLRAALDGVLLGLAAAGPEQPRSREKDRDVRGVPRRP